jgi:hypothetical protein
VIVRHFSRNLINIKNAMCTNSLIILYRYNKDLEILNITFNLKQKSFSTIITVLGLAALHFLHTNHLLDRISKS